MRNVYYLLFAAIIAVPFSSCNKTEGCKDPLSLNFSPDAMKDNHDCDYSTVSFYASGNSHNGIEVLEIIIRLGQQIGQPAEYVGAITTFNQPFPTHCAVAETVKYSIQSGDSHTWHAQYNLVSEGVAFEQGTFSPSNSNACIQIDVLP